MNRPNKQKSDKKYTPVIKHREKIGEFLSKVQHKLEKNEKPKMAKIELDEGTRLIKILLIVLIFCIILVALSLLA